MSRGIEIFDTGDNALGMNILSRANQIAAVEQWNVPRVRLSLPRLTRHLR